MKIAVYGKKDELNRREKKLRKYFSTLNEDVQIDTYVELGLLTKHMLQYDSVCLTEEAVDLMIGAYGNEVTFEWGKKIRTCNVKDIYYAEADLKNVHIWFENAEIVVHLPFGRVEKILAVGDFIKVHRSYLVNCQYIHNIDEHLVTMKDGRTVPLSKYRSEEVRKQYTEYISKRREEFDIGDKEE